VIGVVHRRSLGRTENARRRAGSSQAKPMCRIKHASTAAAPELKNGRTPPLSWRNLTEFDWGVGIDFRPETLVFQTFFPNGEKRGERGEKWAGGVLRPRREETPQIRRRWVIGGAG